MADNDPLTRFPPTFSANTQQPSRRYVRQPDLIALHGPLTDSQRADVIVEIETDAIGIFRQDAVAVSSRSPDLVITPVYAIDPNGALAVPTGRIFVRFQPEIRLDELRRAIEDCGFVIVEHLPYAPNAGWLQAADRGIATALLSFPKLQSIPQLENAEPQMLMHKAQR